MLLTRKANGAVTSQSRLAQGLNGVLAKTIDRRTFLKRSGLTAGAGVAATQLPFSMIGEATAKDAPAGKTEVKRTVCTHCSVGCAIDAVVQDGVWIRQEPVFDSPINLGAHCAKGASIREHGITHDSHRLKYPMKLEGGKWKQHLLGPGLRRDLEEAARDPQARSGPDSLFVVGSSKHNNEQAYLLRKWVSLWGTNNTDHQARICHSTTVARRGPDLGLRRDDQLVQRRAEFEVAVVPRLERGRSAPGVDAAHAARQGERRQGDRRRPALHAHRGEGRHLRALPLRHRRAAAVRRPATTSSRTAGRTSSTSMTASTAWTR